MTRGRMLNDIRMRNRLHFYRICRMVLCCFCLLHERESRHLFLPLVKLHSLGYWMG